MIVPMKTAFLLISRQDRDEALEGLQRLGVMHLSVLDALESEEVEEARVELDRLRQLRERLPHEFGKEDLECAPGDRFDLQEVWRILDRRRRLREKLEELDAECERIRPFGTFDPETVRFLAKRGLTVRLYQSSGAMEPEIPSGAIAVETSRDRERVCFAVIGFGELEVQATEVALPARSLNELEAERQRLASEIEAVNASLAKYAGCVEQLQQEHIEALDRLRFVRARASLAEQGPAFCLKGFVPESGLEDLRRKAADSGWGLYVRDVRKDESPPTLLRLPAWVRPIRSVFELIGVVPGYFETDISTPFLLFLSLFFAMIVGDAGYGALFVGGSLLARHFTSIPRQAFQLLLIMSLCTVVWGLLIGNIFGLPRLPAFMEPLGADWLTGPSSDRHLMLLCFIIGAAQLTLAHIWRLLLLLPELRFLAQLGWIMITWSMFFAARSLVLLEPFPGAMLWVLAAGIGLVVVFMLPLRSFAANWSEYVRLPLDLISSFVDLVSYIRLFAVGTATLAIAAAFNEMAVEVGFQGVLSGAAAAGIIFFGHTLNILLAGMGVLVHGVRLNTLEFAGHTGIQWTGTPYTPFAYAQRGTLG